eukprot:CAMPEP_0170270476 /NCGR_PEP_ID=MMETSP0116_2-20130129/35183_1 /TAXON_ID=400756 /ORGANISM="Durinskia baltica, Strain CSIRO CS-38" /LENGTH=82 /DNA_ID=CAMNT_0010521669 /DNA_START=43 /DNA_END=288 /DNA_ORIENTATION=-
MRSRVVGAAHAARPPQAAGDPPWPRPATGAPRAPREAQGRRPQALIMMYGAGATASSSSCSRAFALCQRPPGWQPMISQTQP